MATSINVNSKTVIRPGIYAITKSGIKNPPVNLSYGNVCIIDDGLGAQWGGGSGVSGVHKQGSDAVVELTTIQQFRDFVKGGPLWDLAKPLFKPAGDGVNGVSKVYLARACATTPAKVNLVFEVGELEITTLDEGINANGSLYQGIMTKGYGVKLVKAGTKYTLQFYAGTFKGIDPLNQKAYDGVAEALSLPSIFLTSPECTLFSELVLWCRDSAAFNSVFKLTLQTEFSDEFSDEFLPFKQPITSTDLTNLGSFTLFAGGTETYNNEHFTSAIEAIKEKDNTFFLALSSGVTEGVGIKNTEIFNYIKNDSKYEKFLIVGAGENSSQFAGASNSSEAVAAYYDSDKVIVVHGGCKETTRAGYLVHNSLWKAAAVLGRMAGVAPQTPLTFKNISIDGEVHPLTDSQKEFALRKGILTTHYDSELGYYVIQQGINSLQKNDYLVNEDASSFDIAVRRIASQLNKEICIRAKQVFFSNDTTGPNRSTINEESIKAWLEGFLQSKIATSLTDNLILRFGNINCEVQEDNFYVSYEFVPNFPISKILFAGILLDK